MIWFIFTFRSNIIQFIIWLTMKIIFYFLFFIIYFFYLIIYPYIIFFSFIFTHHTFLVWSEQGVACATSVRTSSSKTMFGEGGDNKKQPARAAKIIRMRWRLLDAMTFVRHRPKRNQTILARGGDVRANHPGTLETNENSQRIFSLFVLQNLITVSK